MRSPGRCGQRTLRRVPRVLAIAIVLLLLGAGGATAAGPDDLSRDPLDRAALLALPSTYLIESEVRVEALRTADGTRVPLDPRARTVREQGTAFAIGPDGTLVSAAHVAAPSPSAIARNAYLLDQAYRGRDHSINAAAKWISENGVRPVGATATRIRVTQARITPDAPAETYTGGLIGVNRSRDIALLDIPADGAPALDLDDVRTAGTPVVVLGYAGVREGSVPRIMKGRLGLTYYPEGDPDRDLVEVQAPIARGDSGGPVVDREGRVRGMILLRFEGHGYMTTAAEIRTVATAAGVDLGEGATAAAFRSAMNRLWELDLEGAQAGFDETLDRFPAHALARIEERRTEELSAADYGLAAGSRRRGFLIALGVVAAVGAVACALRLGILEANEGRALRR